MQYFPVRARAGATFTKKPVRLALAAALLAATFCAHSTPLEAPADADPLNLKVQSLLQSDQGAPAASDKGLLRPSEDVTRPPAAAAAEKTFLGKFHALRERISNATSDLVLTSMGFLGVPYVRGGNTEYTGFDCSGFVRAVYQKTVGLVLPRVARDQASAGQEVEKSQLQPGDLVFFNTMRRAFSHVGIYVGEGKFIHAPKPGAEVRVDDMEKSYWQKRFNGARRVLPAADAPAANLR